MARAKPVAAEPLQQRHNPFTHVLLLEEGSIGNGVQGTPGKLANTPQDMQQTPQDELFQPDNVLDEALQVELRKLS